MVGAARIVGGKKSPFAQHETHGAKIIAGDAVGIIRAHRFAGSGHVTRNRGGAFSGIAAERDVAHDTRGQHSRQMADFLQQLFKEFRTIAFRIVRPGEQDLSGEHVVGLKSRRDGHHAAQAEAEQARSGEQNESESDLGDDETVPQELRAASGGASAAYRLQRISHMPAKIKPRNRRRDRKAHHDRDRLGQPGRRARRTRSGFPLAAARHPTRAAVEFPRRRRRGRAILRRA